jgi:hypothetical protein
MSNRVLMCANCGFTFSREHRCPQCFPAVQRDRIPPSQPHVAPSALDGRSGRLSTNESAALFAANMANKMHWLQQRQAKRRRIVATVRTRGAA